MVMEDKFSEEVVTNLDRVLKFTQNKSCVEKTKKIIKQYADLDAAVNSDLSTLVAQSLGWVAELKKNPKSVYDAIECYEMNELLKTISKYREDVANEVLIYICYVVEESLSKQEVGNYLKWINNGHVSKLLGVASEFSSNGGLKIQNDIFSILGVNTDGLEKFDNYASKLDGRKMNLQEKIQFLSILKDLVNLKKYQELEKINYTKITDLSKLLEKGIGIKIGRKTSSIKYGILLTEDRKKDKNVDFLIGKHIEHGSIKKWLLKDDVTKLVIDEIEKIGLRSNIFVSSGKKIKEARTDGSFSTKWTEMLQNVVCKIVGSKTKKLPPKVSIQGSAPNTIFDKIKNDYFEAMKGDKEAGKSALSKIRNMIHMSYAAGKLPLPLRHVLDEIEMLEKSIEHDVPLSHKGAKITAKVWTRRVPEDLYDSERLRCCIYLPNGEQMQEIPLFVMDPKTTMVQYFVQGIDDPVAAATLYAGVSKERPVLFLDTWDGGGLAYIALGSDKTKEFVIDTLIKMGKMIGAGNVVIFSKAEYGRPEEFCNYLRRDGFATSKVHFQAVDVSDSVLQKYSAGRKHHYTDAFECNKMEGNIEAFSIEL